MRTLVHFLTGDGRYCVPVEATVGVRSAAGLVPLPVPRPGVIGVLPADPPLTVLSVLGSGRDRILVLAAVGSTFGLLVQEVTGLSSGDEAAIGSPPGGRPGLPQETLRTRRADRSGRCCGPDEAAAGRPATAKRRARSDDQDRCADRRVQPAPPGRGAVAVRAPRQPAWGQRGRRPLRERLRQADR